MYGKNDDRQKENNAEENHSEEKTSRPAVPKVSRTLKPDDMELKEWQRLLRTQYGEQQPFRLENTRMVSDNTWLVDKKAKHGPKLEELETLLREMVIEGGEKVVIFS